MSAKMEVLLIEDHKILSTLLEKQLMDMELVKSVDVVNTLEGFKKRVNQNNYHLIITDLVLPDGSGREVIQFVRDKMGNAVPILVLSSLLDFDSISESINLGANGYVSKDAEYEELEEALTMIEARSDIYLSKSVKEAFVLGSLQKRKEIILTEKEQQVLEYICQSMSVQEIAKNMFLSSHSIQSYIKKLFQKFDVNRTTDLVIKAFQLGKVKPK